MTTMTITVTHDQLSQARDEGSVLTVTGTEDQTGDLVTIAGDWRPMMRLFEGVTESGEATAEVETYQVVHRVPLRRATVAVGTGQPAEAARVVDKYLYGNYRVTGADQEHVYIEGHDDHGFTLDAITDRLASGMLYAREVRS